MNKMKRYVNYAVRRLKIFYKTPYAPQYPHVIKVEPSTYCNLKCPLCITGNGTLNREKGNMSFETFKKIVDEAGRNCTEIQLSNFGENFLNKDIFKMIEYARQSGIRNVSTFSNFLPLSADDIENIVKSGLTEIVISIDGIKQEVYEKYRIGGDLEIVLNNVRKLVEIKKVRKSSIPFIKVQCILTRDTENDVKNIKSFLSRLGVNRVNFKSLFLYERDFNKVSNENIEKYNKFLPGREDFRVYAINNGKLRWRFNPSRKRCIAPWVSAEFTWDGKVLPCCFDWHADYVMGDITKSHFSEIWNGVNFLEFRRSLLKKEVNLCKNCPEAFFDFNNKFYLNI